MSFTTHAESHQTENRMQQRKKLESNINCVKVSDGAMKL